MHKGDEMGNKEQFQEIAIRIGFDIYEEDGEFFYAETRMAYELFQAMKSQAPPEGFVLVPKNSLKVALFWMDENIDPWSMGGDSFADLLEHKPILEKALEAQEQSHD